MKHNLDTLEANYNQGVGEVERQELEDARRVYEERLRAARSRQLVIVDN